MFEQFCDDDDYDDYDDHLLMTQKLSEIEDVVVIAAAAALSRSKKLMSWRKLFVLGADDDSEELTIQVHVNGPWVELEHVGAAEHDDYCCCCSSMLSRN